MSELQTPSLAQVPLAPGSTDSCMELAQRLLALADLAAPFAVRAASALGIPDHIAHAGSSVREISSAAGLAADSLRRLLQALHAYGVVSELEPDVYVLTALGIQLRTDHPFSMRDVYARPGPEVHAWSALDYSVCTGLAAFERLYGVDHCTYRCEHAGEDERMDQSHRAATRIELISIARLFDWTRARVVVDVGGGSGALLLGLLKSFEHLRAILIELPRLADKAQQTFARCGLADRCEVVSSSFFEGVPSGGDVYVLKAVLGSFDDASAVKLLRAIRASMSAESRLLIIEPILGYGPDFTVGNIVHLETLVLYGGPDRSLADYERLFARCGLAIRQITQRATLPLIELGIVEDCEP